MARGWSIGACAALAGLLGLTGAAAAQDGTWSLADFPAAEAPAFEDRPAPWPHWPSAHPVERVDLESHADAATFAGMLESAVGRAPDFATHYVVVLIGCGTGCATVAAVHAQTGRVLIGPVAEAGVEYQATSSLLVVNPPAELARVYGADAIPTSIYPRYYRLSADGFAPVWCWRPEVGKTVPGDC